MKKVVALHQKGQDELRKIFRTLDMLWLGFYGLQFLFVAFLNYLYGNGAPPPDIFCVKGDACFEQEKRLIHLDRPYYYITYRKISDDEGLSLDGAIHVDSHLERNQRFGSGRVPADIPEFFDNAQKMALATGLSKLVETSVMMPIERHIRDGTPLLQAFNTRESVHALCRALLIALPFSMLKASLYYGLAERFSYVGGVLLYPLVGIPLGNMQYGLCHEGFESLKETSLTTLYRNVGPLFARDAMFFCGHHAGGLLIPEILGSLLPRKVLSKVLGSVLGMGFQMKVNSNHSQQRSQDLPPINTTQHLRHAMMQMMSLISVFLLFELMVAALEGDSAV